MSNSTAFRVEGGPRLRSTIKQARGDLNDLKAAHLEAAQLVTEAARPRSPHKSGRLAATGRAAGTATQAIIRFGGAAVPYAGVQHFGWAAHNIKPQPWVTDTAQETEPEWTVLYENAVDKVLATIQGV